MNDDLRKIREEKLMEMKQKFMQKKNDEIRRERIDNYKKRLLGKVLTKKAYERLCFVEQSHPELAQRVQFAILHYAQTNPELRINEAQMKEILRDISSTTKKDFKIIRK